MKYLFLALAIIFEVIGSGLLKASDGFSQLWPSTGVVIAYGICFYFFSLSLKSINLGFAYAVWGGLGIVLTTLVSVFIFKEKLDIAAIIGISLIVSGVMVLNFFSKTTAS